MTYYELKYAVKGKDDKTFWNRCGTMFPAKNGDGFSIVLDAIPVSQEPGSLRLMAFPPKPKDGSPSRNDDPSDDIPF